jgi:DNA-binding response OmpR family regulator
MKTSRERIVRTGQLEIRPDEYVAYCGGHRLSLTGRELALLTELARRSGRVVSRAELYAAVWGGELRDGDRSVDVYVRKLRAKLSRACDDQLIHTHFGFGYRLAAEDPAVSHSQLLHNGVTTA